MHADPSLSAKYLLLDSRVVASSENVKLALGRVEKEPANPLFVEDKPWEVRFDNLYANVLYDGEKRVYRAWYCPFILDEVTANTPPEEREGKPYRPGKREMGVCYAESTDGIHWEKPELGIVEFAGSTANNLVMRHIHGTGVWRDGHDSDPGRRYKAFAQGGVATSPDGLHWEPFQACPEIEAQGDTHNNAFWFQENARYVGITRLWEDNQRIVGRTESTDYERWSKAVEVLRGSQAVQPYAMPVFRHANVWLGLVMMYDTTTDVVDCELAWSPDTVRWTRVCPGSPLIPRGQEGSFDSGCIYAAACPVILPNEVRLYYGGSDGPHSGWRAGALGLARLRPDGFAGLSTIEAGPPGTIVTEPFLCSGKHLYVTADAQGGVVRVALGGSGVPGLENCVPISGNVTNAPIMWPGSHDLGPYLGKQVTLRFELEAATLYAFGFGD